MRGVARSALTGLVAGVAVVAYLFPYFYLPGTWWRAIPSTAVIVLVAVTMFREQAPRLLGLRMTPRAWLISLFVFAVAAFVSNEVIQEIVAREALTASPQGGILGGVHQFFQVLNDEMVLRAAALTLILRVLPYPKLVVLATALVFSLAHLVFYGLHGVQIEVATLVTLFSFGGIANLLFVRFGQIGYGVALHYAWNLTRFGYAYLIDGRPLSEGATFNHLEGNAWVAVNCACVFAIAFGVYARTASSGLPRPLVTSDASHDREPRE